MVLRLYRRAVAVVRTAALPGVLLLAGVVAGSRCPTPLSAQGVAGDTTVARQPLPSAPAQEATRRAPLGPLITQEGAPLQRLGYSMSVEGVDPIPRGSAQVSLWLGYGNVFQRDSLSTHTLTTDLERLITAVSLRWGVSESLDVGARLTFETTGGGWMDGFVESFHRTLGLRDDVRESRPRNAYLQELRTGDGTLVVGVPRRDFTLEEVRLSARWRPLQADDDRWALGSRVELRIPTATNETAAAPSGTPATAGEAVEGAVSILGRTRVWRTHVHLLAGAATVAGAPGRTWLRRVQPFGAASLEIPLSRSVSGVVQWGMSAARLDGFEGNQVDGLHTHLVAGLRGQAGAWGWQAAFQEDLPVLGSSADFSLQLGVSRRW